jgi:acyl-CoA synthetase (AMP-forming)/AMP-acid ligase II
VTARAVSRLGTTHAIYAPNVPGSIGVALPGTEVRVADLDDVTRDAPPDVPGELMVRGPIVMVGRPSRSGRHPPDPAHEHRVIRQR